MAVTRQCEMDEYWCQYTGVMGVIVLLVLSISV
jgi:hypothetical protein